MLKITFDGLWKVFAASQSKEIGEDKPGLGLNEDDFQKWSGKIGNLLVKVGARNQGFDKVIDDQEMVGKIRQYADAVRGRYENIVVLGIGGSSLGAACLDQVLGGLYGPAKGQPRLFVLDNIDPVLLAEFEEQVDFSKTLFLVISKSGGTPETLAQFLYFKKRVLDAGLKLEEHFVFVTDPEKGLLRKLAKQNPAVKSFEVPDNVGGRFSVLSAVGLLPAALMGYDIEKLLEGARDSREQFMSKSLVKNTSFKLALTQYLLYAKGIHMTVTFPYAQKLIKFSDWYRQLLAESIGKAVNDQGTVVHLGITPIHSLGATDQHSQNQLYTEGPNDKLYIFMEVLKPAVDLEIPFEETFQADLGYLKGISFNRLLKTEMEGTILALQKVGRPCLRISVEQLNEYALGELFMLFEGSIAFLGELFEINAFDQPGVELSKNLTKQMLS